MAAGDRSQKTEKPTQKRMREAREKGQVARSPDLAMWIGLIVTTMLLQATIHRGATTFPGLLHKMGAQIANPDERKALGFFGDGVLSAVSVVAPIAVGMLLLNIVVNLAQVGRPSAKRLKLDMKRMSPVSGLKRMFSPMAWWELAKAIVKVAVLGAVAWPTVHAVAISLTSQGGSLSAITSATAQHALTLLRDVAAVGLVIAAIDYTVQRRKLRKDLMMTRHEVKEEMRQQEGDPRLRSAVRSRQQAISRNRMIRMVATADVVVVNPTHFAVALKYDAARGAPELVAKGADHLAARIRLEATRNQVPIVHEPALTRALYKACPVGALIPFELYEAVAHLLAFIFALRAQNRAEGYHEFGRSLVEV
ncbi:MAG TPA: EscU/YscU/HrcU family type III secretion system export apparatus switch protein [Acidimicrobiia bacterium]